MKAKSAAAEAGMSAPNSARAHGRAIPTPLDLLSELEEMRQIALNRTRMVWSRGVPTECDEPDVKAAIQATMGKAAICGYIRQTPTFETPQLVEQAMRRALSDPELRRMLVEQLRAIEPALLAEAKK